MPRRFWFDTEFHEHRSGRCELISLGIVADDGRMLYIETEFDRASAEREPWLRDNVLENLVPGWPTSTHHEARVEVENFLAPTMAIPRPGDRPELWAYFASTDWTLLYRLWGRMVDLPRCMPHHPFCLQQWWRQLGCPPCKPPKPTGIHNALEDAKWNRDFWHALTGWCVANGRL